jgi:regulation of enolase protein 1 (concanavalin A-like superfamily)
LGLFTNSADVGAPAIKGSAEFDAAKAQYRISGSGANIWGAADQFQYVWREITGNFSATATVQFVGQGAEHRKAGIMVRQSLDADAAYADIMIHGNGMPGLQWRNRKGDDTNTFDLPYDHPATYQVKLVRTGVKIFMYLSQDGGEPKLINNTEVSFQNPVLLGLAVCSHDAAVSDTVVFSHVAVILESPPAGRK